MPRSIPRPFPQCIYPNCGKILSRRTAKYCREHIRFSPEYLENHKKGYNSSVRAKMAASAKERANTPEGKARMSNAAKAQGGLVWKGRKHSGETKAVIREKRAKQIITPEAIEKGRAKIRGRPNFKRRGQLQSQETKDQISATLQSKRDHLSQKGRERYARETEDQREKRLKPWIQAGQDNIPTKDTTIELFIAQQLGSLGIEYQPQKKISYYIVDFCIPSRMIVIEAQGCYWHGCLQCGFDDPWHAVKRRNDQARTERLVKKGYTVIPLWEHEIRLAMQDSSHVLQLGLE